MTLDTVVAHKNVLTADTYDHGGISWAKGHVEDLDVFFQVEVEHLLAKGFLVAILKQGLANVPVFDRLQTKQLFKRWPKPRNS